jgi:superfamily I DNA/RNA helicase
MVEHCKTSKAEGNAVVAWVQLLMKEHGLATHEICVTPYKPEIRTILEDANIATLELKPREEDPGEKEPGVRMGTMKRIKGLEFRAVAMACADKDDPLNQLADAESRDRCERYVAATRAREHLLVLIGGSEKQST